MRPRRPTDRRLRALEVARQLGPLMSNGDFRAAMVLRGLDPGTHPFFCSVRDEVWPDWRADKAAAKRDKQVQANSWRVQR